MNYLQSIFVIFAFIVISGCGKDLVRVRTMEQAPEVRREVLKGVFKADTTDESEVKFSITIDKRRDQRLTSALFLREPLVLSERELDLLSKFEVSEDGIESFKEHFRGIVKLNNYEVNNKCGSYPIAPNCLDNQVFLCSESYQMSAYLFFYCMNALIHKEKNLITGTLFLRVEHSSDRSGQHEEFSFNAKIKREAD